GPRSGSMGIVAAKTGFATTCPVVRVGAAAFACGRRGSVGAGATGSLRRAARRYPAGVESVLQTELPLPNRRQGKVRDIYDLPAAPGQGEGPRLLIVASDRISAFDVVMPTPIPGKGRLLTEISARWFAFIEQRGLARTHALSRDV